MFGNISLRDYDTFSSRDKKSEKERGADSDADIPLFRRWIESASKPRLKSCKSGASGRKWK